MHYKVSSRTADGRRAPNEGRGRDGAGERAHRDADTAQQQGVAMTQEETEQAVEEALERWRNPPPLTEEERRRERAASDLMEMLGEDEDD
ncbi:hypothetical protein Mx9_p35 [Myxococcus phage Mx9]|nr:hypothetical protein Mx9_p35 [Myxococcus phage Mx9]